MPSATDPAQLERLLAENAELRIRLAEAEETLQAIREGEVDAIVVSGSHGDRVFSLAETENLHRQMVETMNEAGLATSADGLLLYCNERAATLLGRPRSLLLGHRLDELVAPQDADRLSALLAASARGTADDRVVFCAADQAAVPLHLWASRLQCAQGSLICLVGTDLSRLEAERALAAQLQEQQQALMASRAEALTLMRQAVAARETAARAVSKLRAADRRKDAFLATLAHELRNPLAPIQNALAILRLAAPGDPEALDALAVIERQLTHLVRLLDDLLEVSRITRGKIDLRKEPVDLWDAIAAAVETVQPLIDAAHQRLTLTPANEAIWVEADPVRLAQVFGNLLNNATKYTGVGGEIQLSVEPKAEVVEVSVRDTGAGISQELLPHVFELFRQGAPEHAHGRSGLGIGLSLVKRLTRLHGGRVAARSDGPGQGSEFRVQLPLLAVPPTKSARPAERRPQERPTLAPICRILVVDDNQDAANSLGRLLARQGGEVEIAYDGPSALARLEARPSDVVILDIGMPGMDGHEVARRIRARSDLRQPTLIALSGLGQDADRQRSLQAGLDYHLVKPVPLDVLGSLLSAEWVERPRRGPIPESAPGRSLNEDAPCPSAPDCADDAEPRRAPAEPAPSEQLPDRTQERVESVERLGLAARPLLHELAQPLNTAACYAVAVRNLTAESTGESSRLGQALRGIEQQIQLAGAALERLRELFRGLDTTDSGGAERAPGGGRRL